MKILDEPQVSSGPAAFLKMSEQLLIDRKILRRARLPEDGDVFGPWLIIQDGAMIDSGTLGELMKRHESAAS